MDSKKDTVSGTGIVREDADFYFLYSKAEKLVTALYMVSNFFPTSEPLKLRIKDIGLSFLSENVLLRNGRDIHFFKIKDKICDLSSEIVSLLQIAYYTQLVSEMNFGILKDEFERFAHAVRSSSEDAGSAAKGFSFPPHFFQDSLPSPEGSIAAPADRPAFRGSSAPQALASRGSDSKGHSRDAAVSFKKNVSAADSKHRSSERKDAVPQKSNRHDLILEILKKSPKSGLGIKDFSLVLKDCSEKTIQRELLLLVQKNVLKKEGERRWSKYSLR